MLLFQRCERKKYIYIYIKRQIQVHPLELAYLECACSNKEFASWFQSRQVLDNWKIIDTFSSLSYFLENKQRASSLLRSSIQLAVSMRWCVVIISNPGQLIILDKNFLFILNLKRYTRCLIKYHLFIFSSILIMTSICIGLLIYKYDQIHFGNLLKVKNELANDRRIFFSIGFSSTWNKILR